jgi:TonB family protein
MQRARRFDNNEDPAMQTRRQWLVWVGVVGASLGAHAVAFGGLGRGGWNDDGLGKRRKPAMVEMMVAPPKPKAPEPAPAEPAVHKLALARPARVKAAAAPPPSAAAPPPAAESPADFTGTTLTNDGAGDGWASATGNGEKMNGPVGRPGAHVTRRVVDGDASGAGHGPPVVGLGDLSRAPSAPDLVDALAAAYPAEARAKGLAGKAVVRARVMPDGRVRELALVSESASGFGDACERTLRDSKWSPPFDRDGHAVSTFINYTCRFNVE